MLQCCSLFWQDSVAGSSLSHGHRRVQRSSLDARRSRAQCDRSPREGTLSARRAARGLVPRAPTARTLGEVGEGRGICCADLGFLADLRTHETSFRILPRTEARKAIRRDSLILSMNESCVEKTVVSTRRQARRIAVEADQSGVSTLDFSPVDFVSRSAADEFVHQSEKRSLELRGLGGDVATMIDAVRDDSAAPA
jgi:hypothetical protein